MTWSVAALIVTAVLSVFAELRHQWATRVTRSDEDTPPCVD